jgi:hypothetical protein
VRRSGIETLIKTVYKPNAPVGYYQFTLTCALDDLEPPEKLFGQLQELSPEDQA